MSEKNTVQNDTFKDQIITALQNENAVLKEERGKYIGEQLVLDSMAKGKELGFRVLQFNAVVESNIQARRLYEKLGFTQLGTIAGGFRMKDGHYESTCPYFIEL